MRGSFESVLRESVAVTAVLALSGCTTAGTPSPGATRTSQGTVAIAGQAGPNMVVDMNREVAQSQFELAASPAQVWPLMAGVFVELGIEPTEVKPREQIIGNPRFRPRRVAGERLSRFIDCGRDHGGAYADQHEVWMTVMAQVLPAPDGGSTLHTLVTGTARPRNVTAGELSCQSNGELEGRIVAEIVAALAGSAERRTRP